jgi:hypothetical protein
MFTEKERNKINQIIKDEVFNFGAQWFGETEFSFDYMFELVGQRKMMSVGEYYMYEEVDVTIVGSEKKSKMIMKIFYSNIENKETMIDVVFKRDYRFMSSLNESISSNLKYFTSEPYVRVKLKNVEMSDELFNEILNTEIKGT